MCIKGGRYLNEIARSGVKKSNKNGIEQKYVFDDSENMKKRNPIYLWPLSAVFAFDVPVADAVGCAYPFSFTLRLAAWQSTLMSIKLMTVSTRHGNNLIMTEWIQKLMLRREEIKLGKK